MLRLGIEALSASSHSVREMLNPSKFVIQVPSTWRSFHPEYERLRIV
jgi:hypothetical protein